MEELVSGSAVVIHRIKEVYGIGRSSRMADLFLLKDGWDGKDAKSLNHPSVGMFLEFTERFGKVADDIAMFLDPDGNLDINWSYFVDDVTKHRRCGNSRHVQLCFQPDGVLLFLDEFRDQEARVVAMDSQELNDVIEKYRTHRLPV